MSSAEATPYFLNAVAAVSVIDLLQLSALEQSDSDEESSSPSTEPTTPTSSTFSSSPSGGHSNAMAEMMLDPSEGVGAESDEPVPATDEVSDEVRLERLVKEFGSWCDESERYQTQIPGALHRGVLIKGLIALTNRRLFFFAYVPRREPEDVIIRSGPCTIFNSGVLKNKARQRVWVELRSDAVTFFKDSSRLTKPLGACRMSQIKAVHPYDPENPKSFAIEMNDNRIRRPMLDTSESAMAWSNAIETTLYRFRATADRLRLSIPLELVSDLNVTPYFVFADRLDIELDHEIGSVAICFLRSLHEDFLATLERLMDDAKANPSVCKVQPIVEVDGQEAAEDRSMQTQLSNDKSLPAQFVAQFGLSDLPSSLFIESSCELVRTLPAWGALAISARYLLFWRRSILGGAIRLRLPLSDLDKVAPAKAFGFHIFGLCVTVHGAPDVRLDFHSRAARDQVLTTLDAAILQSKAAALSLATAPPSTFDGTVVLGQSIEESVPSPTGPIFYSPSSAPPLLNVKVLRRPVAPSHFICLTIGSRGDVQPYIALALELMKDGHRVSIASHPEYREWVQSYGDIGYFDVGGDPAALMELNVKHRMFSPGFFQESLKNFRTFFDLLLLSSWDAVQTADVIIESPATLAGIHCAEALNIPYFRCFTMPWTKTTAYPQAFASGADLGPTYNSLSYSVFDKVYWTATSGQVNRWRKNTLHLKPTNLHNLSQAKTPFIYNFSPSFVAKPNDWADWIHVAGYFFLDSPTKTALPDSLLAFIAKARDDGVPVLYVGFGSIVVPDSAAMTRAIVKAGAEANVRIVFTKGWSERGGGSHEEVELPAEVYSISSVPHDILFPLIDAAVHHGGAGSTGASLRAGLPTLIHPFFGDQHFWASRVEKLGVGFHVRSLDAKDLAAAFKASSSRIMKEKAQDLGRKIRSENGTLSAKEFLYSHLHLAQERTELRSQRAAGKEKGKESDGKHSSPGGTPTRSFSFPLPLRKKSIRLSLCREETR